MLIDKLEPSELEKRIVNLETTALRAFRLIETLDADYKDRLVKVKNDYTECIAKMEIRLEEMEDLLEEE